MIDIEYKKIVAAQWLNKNTSTTNSVVELGAGFFKNLARINPNVKTKVGIEIYKPYIDNAVFRNCTMINGDALKYRDLLNGFELDTVLLYDILEHFNKDVGFELIENLKKDFNRILLMLPFGKFEQDSDITGYGGHEYQKHRSYWYLEDVKMLKFNENIIDNVYHASNDRVANNLDTACYFGVWEK